MACEMETVLPSFVLVMAMPMLDCPFVRVIEVEGASVCSTVAISPNVIGVGIAAEVCIPEGKDEGLLVPDVVDVGKVAVPVAPVVVDQVHVQFVRFSVISLSRTETTKLANCGAS